MSLLSSTSYKLTSTDQQLLLLTSVENHTLEYCNNFVETYCGLDRKLLQDEHFDFYKEFLHPDDYPKYVAHLKSYKEDISKSETNFLVRLKNKEGQFNTFNFSNRLYKRKNLNKSSILTTATLAGKKSPSTTTIFDTENSSGEDEIRREYQQLVNSLQDGFCVVELIYDEHDKPVDYLYLKTNPAFEKHVAFKDVQGKTVSELVANPKEDWLKKFGDVALTGRPVRFEEHNSNLGDVWLDLHAFKVGGPEERKIAILFRNITDIKVAEEQIRKELEQHHEDLRQSNQLLQSVFDTTNLGIGVFKTIYNEDGSVKDFEFARLNKVLLEMYQGEEMLGKSYLEYTKYGIELGIFDALKKVMTTGESIDNERFFNKEGYHHWFRITARAQEDLLIASIEDITARKAEAEELKENIRFKQQLVRTTPEVVMIINLNNFNVRYINKDILKEVGLTKENIQGKPLPDILPYVHPRDREKVIELHRNLLKASVDKIFDIEVRLKLKGTDWEWFNVRGKIFRRRDEGWVDEYVLLIRNITEQKNTQKALIKAETFSIQGEVARTFAHELRNPLASIGMVREVLNKKMDDSDKEKFNMYFNILKRSTETLNDLVSKLLNASNYTPSVLEKGDLSEILTSTLDKAADRIYLAGIKVIKKYDGPYFIMADKEKLEIAILNILVNASEATIPGEGIIEVEIQEKGSDFVLSITDNGHGLEQDQIKRLFEAFYTNKEAGMGVGLSSVKNILEEHDADIEVSSTPKVGTSFHISFHNAEKE